VNRTAATTCLLALSACVISPPGALDELPSPWLVDRPRLLAISVEPPELTPDGSATIQVLLPDPRREADATVILGCEGYGLCPLDLGDVSVRDFGEQEWREHGAIGVVGLFDAVATGFEPLFEGLDDQQREEGISLGITVMAIPASATGKKARKKTDYDEVEAGFRSLTVRDAETLNRNPTLYGLLANGEATPASGWTVKSDQTLSLDVEVTPDSWEEYRDGETEWLDVQWFTDDGAFEWSGSTPGEPVEWTSPEERGQTGTIWAVVRDGRGGQVWVAREFTTR